jgi:hypothetical protein
MVTHGTGNPMFDTKRREFITLLGGRRIIKKKTCAQLREPNWFRQQ